SEHPKANPRILASLAAMYGAIGWKYPPLSTNAHPATAAVAAACAGLRRFSRLFPPTIVEPAGRSSREVPGSAELSSTGRISIAHGARALGCLNTVPEVVRVDDEEASDLHN